MMIDFNKTFTDHVSRTEYNPGGALLIRRSCGVQFWIPNVTNGVMIQ